MTQRQRLDASGGAAENESRRHHRARGVVKLKELLSDWPPDDWTRGSLAWDNNPGILKLAAVSAPGAAGTFELVASDAQLCRWSSTLVIGAPEYSGAVSASLAGAIGRTLAEIGELELEA